jgi:hypothetical protein
MIFKMVRKLAVVGVATGVAFALIPAGSASAASHCHYSVTTKKYSCRGASGVRGANDVIGAKLFTDPHFGGSSVTIWVPRPCPDNGKIDFYADLGASRNKVSSVQGWGNCWVWLFLNDGGKEGPYKGNVGDVGSYADNRAVRVGLS